MNATIQHRGKLIHECSIEGESRREGFFPGHINGLPVGKNRFLLLYTTRGWRGTDDNINVIYQLRDGGYDGPLIREGRLARSIQDWSPLGDGKHYVKGYVHPLVFGLPKNALVKGAVPVSPEGNEWIGSSAFTSGTETRVAAMKFRFDAETGLYEWTDTGPMSASGLSESSVMAWGNAWIISARVQTSTRSGFGGPIAWMLTDDPFLEISEPVYPDAPSSRSPSTAFLCADGQVRLVTNDRGVSPYRHHRNPLYLWDIDPDNGFTAGEPAVVFDSVAGGVPIREESRPVVDQGKIFPHAGGKTQIIAHRIRPVSLNDPEKTGVVISEEEKTLCGIYYGSVNLDREYPGVWSFP